MKILVAEDEPISRRLLENMLVKWGHEVVSAADGRTAWTVLQAKHAPEIAILDWMMPGMDGVDIVREIRKSGRPEYIYVIMLTGRGEKKDLIQALEAGTDDYIVKPFEPDELRARIRCGERVVQLQSDLMAEKARQEIINEDLVREISERQRVEKQIAQAKREWERTFDTVPDLIAVLDSQHRIVRLNRSMADVLRVHPKDAIGRLCYEVCHATDAPPSYCPFVPMMRDGMERTIEVVQEKLGGCFMLSVTPLYDEQGRVSGCVHVARDITEKKKLEEELRHLASHDPLTGLPNRRHFLETLAFIHENAKRYGNPLSVAVFDIDYFKDVNDEYGHQAGDRVLKTFGRIMREQLRSGDAAGRYGGDEFIVAFPQTAAGGASGSVERILSVLERTDFPSSAGAFRVSCTAGIAELAPGQATVDDLIHAADMALYQAKHEGRNRVVVLGVGLSAPIVSGSPRVL